MTRLLALTILFGFGIAACTEDPLGPSDPVEADFEYNAAGDTAAEEVAAEEPTYSTNPVDAPWSESTLQAPDVSGSFQFISPLGPDDEPLGTFDPVVLSSLRVSVCRLVGDACGGTAVAAIGPGQSPNDIRIDATEIHYMTRWKPARSGAQAGERFRIDVGAAGLPLGSVSVVVQSGRPIAGQPGDVDVRLREYVPIRFHVDENPRVRAWTMRAAAQPPSDIAARLRDEFGLGATETFDVMNEVGHSPAETGEALTETFGLDSNEVAEALKIAGYDASELLAWLEEAFGMGAEEAAETAIGAGYGIGAVTEGLRVVYGTDAEATASVLLAVGVQALAAGPALEETFGITEVAVVEAMDASGFALEEVIGWLQTANSRSLEESVQVLHDAAIVGSRVAEVLIDILRQPKEFVFNVMTASGYGFRQFATVVLRHFGRGILPWLIGAGVDAPEDFTLEEVAGWAFNIAGLTATEVAVILHDKGVAAQDVVDWLKTELPGNGASLASEISAHLDRAGFTLTQIAEGLQSFGIETATEGLRVAGYAADKVGSALEVAYGIGEDRVVQAMDAAGFTLEQTLDWLQTAKGKTLEEAAGVLKAGGVTASRMAALLKDVLGNPKEFIFDLLTAVGFGFERTANALVEHFQTGILEWLVGQGLELPDSYNLEDVAGWALDAGGLALDRVVELMEQKGVPASEVVYWLTTELPGGGVELATEIVGILERANYTAGEIAEGMTSFGAQITAEGMKLAGWTANKVGDAIHGAYGFTTEATGAVLRTAGFGVEKVAGWVEHTIGTVTPIVLAVILKDIGFVGEKVAVVLKKVKGATDKLCATALKGAGYAVGSVAKAIKKVYSLDAHGGAAAMAFADYTWAEITLQLMDVWETDVFGVAQILKDLGAGFDQVLDALVTVTGEGIAVITAIIGSLWI